MYLGNTPTLTIRTDFVFVATNGQTVFTGIDSNGLTLSYNTNNCDVFANGVLQQRIEYTTTSASAITFATPRQANDVITIRSYGVPANVDSIMQGKFETANVGFLGAYRNKIINGHMEYWQRGTSFANDGYTADRWGLAKGTGSTHSVTRADFIADDSLPYVDKYTLAWSRTVAGSTPSYLIHKIEGARTLAGKTCTLTVWARSTAATRLKPYIQQRFGTGGTPSATEPYIPSNATEMNLPVGGSLKRYDFIFTLRPISTKTFGTNNDDALWVLLEWSNADPNTVIAVSRVSLVEGDARLETDPFSPRHPQQELALCQRYYEIGLAGADIYDQASGNSSMIVNFRVQKRVTPAITQTVIQSTNFTNTIITEEASGSVFSFRSGRIKDGSVGKGVWTNAWYADAEL